MEDAALRAALERFVLDNEDLLELEATIGAFNIFDALRVSLVEIRHSNFLGWLLDPAESHGQGDLFLQAFLMDVLSRAEGDVRPINPVVLDGADLGGADVEREWKGIDLLIRSDAPRLLVLVENKIGAREGRGQLGRYERIAATAYPGMPRLQVYLTPGGDASSRRGWVPYTYVDLHGVLARCRRRRHSVLGPDVAVVLDHYLGLLRRRFMNDPEIDELCRRIYKTHRQALDLRARKGITIIFSQRACACAAA